MIYTSTGGMSTLTALEAATLLSKAGIFNFELSGGKFDEKFNSSINEISSLGNIQLHNYFPPPKNPFVLNLASSNHEIANRSILHIKNAIDLSVQVGSYLYSFHAGFLLDPKVKELGRRVGKQKLIPRSRGMKFFLDNLNIVADYASQKSVKLLVENNVLSHANFKHFGDNPFLMADAEECIFVMNETNENVQLLIDVAHLKVSANSLGFSKKDFLTKVNPWIFAYHLSDNDGLSDSNNQIKNDSWFWPYLKSNLNYYSIEVYDSSPSEIASQVQMTRDKLNCFNENL